MRNNHARRLVPSVKFRIAAVRPEVGLLHEVFGVGAVAGHAQRRAVQLRRVLHRLLGELGPVCHTATLAAALLTRARPPELTRSHPKGCRGASGPQMVSL